jgi:hypothetical protein
VSVCLCVRAAHRHQGRLESTQQLHYLHLSSEKRGALCGLCDGCTFANVSRLEAMRQVDLTFMSKCYAEVLKKIKDKQERVNPLQACAIESHCCQTDRHKVLSD